MSWWADSTYAADFAQHRLEFFRRDPNSPMGHEVLHRSPSTLSKLLESLAFPCSALLARGRRHDRMDAAKKTKETRREKEERGAAERQVGKDKKKTRDETLTSRSPLS